MKKAILIGFILLLPWALSFGQYVPLGINYQAIARNYAGHELKDANLKVKISILSEGIIEYAETHSVKTDQFGLFQLIIGQGSYFSGTVDEFNNIGWGLNTHSLKVEVDFGEGPTAMGTMPFLAVPYALYAATSGSTDGKEDYDKDPENELQFLSLEDNGQTLKISNGNSLLLKDVVNDADADPLNEIQDLDLDPQTNILTITKNVEPTEINLTPYKTLIQDGNKLSISDGNIVNIDADPVNELQEINLDGYDLSLSQGGGSVNLRPDIIAFRALKTNSGPQNSGDTVSMIFNVEMLDTGNGILQDGYYDNEKGLFTVPAGGAGLYYFDLNYNFSLEHSLAIRVNGKVKELVFDGYGIGVSGVKSYSFVYMLNDGDRIRIDLILNSAAFCGKGTFYGYRIH